MTETSAYGVPDPRRRLHSAWDGAVYAPFVQQAQGAPSVLAVVDPDAAWTYGDLAVRSAQLANYLLASGIQPQDVVAIYAQRSAALVVAVCGILQAGAAYLILDARYPAAYLIECLRLAPPRGWIALAAAGALPQELHAFVAQAAYCCRLDLPQSPAAFEHTPDAAYATSAPDVAVGPDDLAYMVFTSGTTGTPKAVQGVHRPLSHFLCWYCQTLPLHMTDRFSMLSGLSYDALLRDMFTPLWLGATLYVPAPDDISSGRLATWLQQYQLSVLHLTPATLQLLTLPASRPQTTNTHLRYVLSGGDVLTRDHVARLRQFAPAATCVNCYGATETPQIMGYYIVPDIAPAALPDTIPLGRGIQDVQLLVLDAAQQLADIGALGEIYIRTPYLARGYAGDAALTQERFIQNPFTNTPGDRLYRTGDLGRYLSDGTVAFAGRADHQVTLRGYRIELGAIEATLRRHPEVQDVVVVRQDSPGDGRLVAYIVPEPGTVSTTDQWRSFLQRQLPEQMIPAAFVVLDRLPLTPNGKVNRGALPVPTLARAEAALVAPRTPIEAALSDMWAKLLGCQEVGIHENFL